MCHRTWDEPALCSSVDRTACDCTSIQPSMLHRPHSGPQVWPVTNHIKAHCLMAPETVMGPAGLLPSCLQLLGMLPCPSTSGAMGTQRTVATGCKHSNFVMALQVYQLGGLGHALPCIGGLSVMVTAKSLPERRVLCVWTQQGACGSIILGSLGPTLLRE